MDNRRRIADDRFEFSDTPGFRSRPDSPRPMTYADSSNMSSRTGKSFSSGGSHGFTRQ